MKSMLNAFRRIPASPIKRFSGYAALLAGSGAAVAFVYRTSDKRHFTQSSPFLLMVNCAAKFKPQSSVINEAKEHALFLTIHLHPSANAHEILKSIGKIQQYVDEISPPSLRDESDEIWFGVGFGPEYLKKLKPNALEHVVPFPYRPRSGALGDMPYTGGDIFIHAKCNERGKLFELAQALLNGLPSKSVSKFEDIYGWTYRNGRDLSGFIDGTENPADPDDRIKVAIDPKSGGSYAITQRWVHNFSVIRSTRDDVKSQWIGRELEDSTELKKKSSTSHVARMVGSTALDAEAKYQIVRHSQPYGTLAGDAGLFFMAYSATPLAFDWMLDRMTGHGDDKQCDDVMRMTQCVSGNYWYFPSLEDFQRMTGSSGGLFRSWI